MALTIASLNVRGLQDNLKRREVFNWLRQKHFSIYMLQEVHCTENTNDRWTAEWGYQSIFSTFKRNKSGVSILFNNNFNLQIQRVYIDPSGRFIICDIKADDTCLTLANIYAPNEDSPAFLHDFFYHLSDFKCEDIVIGGDYNLVLDLDTTREGAVLKHTKTVRKFWKKILKI